MADRELSEAESEPSRSPHPVPNSPGSSQPGLPTPGSSQPGSPRPTDRAVAAAAAGLLALVRRLPPERAVAAGGWLGRSYARLHGPRTEVGRINLRIAFPEWSEERRAAVLERSLDHLARGLVEFAQLSTLDPAALRERVAIKGMEHLDAARKASRTGGVVMLTGHFGSWELLSVAMSAAGVPVAVVHRPRDNPALDAVVNGLRSARGSLMLPRGSAARAALRALRDGKCLAMPYDQNCRRNEGVFVPFFGRLACTRDGPPRVAMRTGAPVVPIFLHRQPDGFRHVARILPALEMAPEGDDKRAAIAENARRMTRVIEAEIRRAPDHWTWIHRRFRTQPPGEPRPYPSRRR